MNDKHNIVVKLISSSLSIAILTALAYFWGQMLRSRSFPDEAGISPDLLSSLQNEEFLLLGAQLGIVTILSCFVLWKLLFWGFERFPKTLQNKIVTSLKVNRVALIFLGVSLLLYLPPFAFCFFRSKGLFGPELHQRPTLVSLTCKDYPYSLEDYAGYKLLSRKNGFISLMSPGDKPRHFVMINENDILILKLIEQTKTKSHPIRIYEWLRSRLRNLILRLRFDHLGSDPHQST